MLTFGDDDTIPGSGNPCSRIVNIHTGDMVHE